MQFLAAIRDLVKSGNALQQAEHLRDEDVLELCRRYVALADNEAAYQQRQTDHFKQRMAEMIFVAMHVGVGPASIRDYMGGRASGAYDAAEAFVTEMKRRGGSPS